MPSDLRVVFDTNTLISAFLLSKSIPRQALDTATAAGRLLLSTATATELTEVLRQPKFDRYLAQHRRMTLLAVVIHNADLVDVDVTITDCRDPKDNKFLELAVSGQATHLAQLPMWVGVFEDSAGENPNLSAARIAENPK